MLECKWAIFEMGSRGCAYPGCYEHDCSCEGYRTYKDYEGTWKRKSN